MNEKHLKWANCCSKDISCSACDSNATCSDWAIYLDGHRRAKGYCHFDLRTSLADSATRRKVLNPEWVSHHGFFPLIRYEQKRDKFGVSGGIAQVKHKEPRVIRYCSHLDRCVFQRYAFLFDEAYEAYIKPLRVGESVIAYRRGEGKSNIDHAKRAFDFIQKPADAS